MAPNVPTNAETLAQLQELIQQLTTIVQALASSHLVGAAKCVRSSHMFDMFQRLQKLKQGKRSVEEYSAEFFSLLSHLDDLKDYDDERKQKIKDVLSLSSPLNVAEACRKALIVEAQIKGKFWGKVEKSFTLSWCLVGFGFATLMACIDF
ncbi:unnamed protein product [Cochlearia groenlandica]